MVFCQIVRLSRDAVRGDHLKFHRIAEAGVIVKGQECVGNGVIDELLVEDAVLRPKIFHSDVAVFRQHVDVGDFGASALSAFERQAVAGAGGNADAVGECDASIHETVQNA